MRESRLEQYFRKQVVQRGGWTIKLTGTKGIPDRLVMLPGGVVVFVELKTDTGRRSKIQKAVIAKLSKLGCTVEVLYGKDQVDEWFATVS